VIELHSIKIDIATWPGIPLIFDIESEKFIVFSSSFNSAGCHLYSKYNYQNGVWVEEKLLPKFEQRDTNLLIFDDKNMQPLINLETKRKHNSDVRTQDFWKVGPIHPYCR
jgi:hypothetical protein